jgi:hypothetical protein
VCRVLHTPSLEAVCLAASPRRPSSRQRMTAAQKAGLAFQRKLARALPSSTSGPWIAFRDRNGAGLAQPDLYIQPLPDGSVLLFEAKLKLTAVAVAEARRQVEGLYLPLLSQLYPNAPLRAAITGRYLAEGATGARPLTELSWRDFEETPMLTYWDAKRELGGLVC